MSAPEAVDWVRNNGNPYKKVIEREIPPTDPDDDPIVLTTTLFGSKFDTFELVGSWYYDSRNRAIFADRGLQHSLSVAVIAPGSEVDYYTLRYNYLQLLPIWKPFLLGCLVLGTLSALAGYALLGAVWRFSVAMKYHRRRTATGATGSANEEKLP